MKKNFFKTGIIAGAFLIALAIALIFSGSDEKTEISYTVLGDSTLPVISLGAEGYDVNTLYGYLGEVNEKEAQRLITPLGKNREIKASVYVFGNTVTGISYEIRSLDGSDLIEKTELENWSESEGVISAMLPVKDISGGAAGRRLKIILTTEKISEINYYSTIVEAKDYKTAEMLSYVNSFHNASFDAAKAQEYAVNWEPDGSGDDENLAFVDIHSSFRQFTYKDLAPKQAGPALLDILELDETFGSFLLRFELLAENEYGKTDRYKVEEFFCVQWTQQRFYLMAYERRMTQVFEAGETGINEDGLNFGVVREEDILSQRSENGTYFAFVQAGELWCYSAEKEEIGQVFSFSAAQNLLYKLNDDYRIKIMSVSDEGDISFIVYGYMLRGGHEGECGLSFYKYSRKDNILLEIVYLTTDHTVDAIEKDLDVLCVKKGKLTYLLFDDTIFSVNEEGGELVRVIEGASAHNVKTNAAQSAFAWIQDVESGISSKLQVRYLDTGKTSVISVSDDEYVRPWGFIENDFFYTVGDRSEIGTVGFDRSYPQKELIIADENGKSIGGYKKQDVRIGRVIVEDGKIILERIKKTGSGYENIENEVLMQSDKEIKKEEKLLRSEILEKRQRVWKLVIKKAPEYDDCRTFSPGQISPAKESYGSDTNDERNLFYAYAKGEFTGVYENAGEAVLAVSDDMGYVIDSGGNHVWHRKGKSINGAKIILPKDVKPGEGLLPLDMCVEMVLKYEGINGVSAEDFSSFSASQLLSEKAGLVVMDLTGCTIRQSMIFLEKGAPLIMLGEDDAPYLITGYDSANITIYSFEKDSYYKMGQEKAESLAELGGKRILSYVKR